MTAKKLLKCLILLDFASAVSATEFTVANKKSYSLFDVLDQSDYDTDVWLRNVSKSNHHLLLVSLICSKSLRENHLHLKPVRWMF